MAKVPAGATKDQIEPMLQNLLVERFGMTFHRETRQVSTCELVVAKDGAKVTAASAGAAQAGDSQINVSALPKGKDGWPILPPEAVGRFGTTIPPYTRIMYRGEPISLLADFLKGVLQCPFIDKTRLAGLYNFDITFQSRREDGSPLMALREQPVSEGGMAMPAAPTGLPAGAAGMAPYILEAMEKQIGLKVAFSKGPYEVVVVDHVNNKPTDN